MGRNAGAAAAGTPLGLSLQAGADSAALRIQSTGFLALRAGSVAADFRSRQRLHHGQQTHHRLLLFGERGRVAQTFPHCLDAGGQAHRARNGSRTQHSMKARIQRVSRGVGPCRVLLKQEAKAQQLGAQQIAQPLLQVCCCGVRHVHCVVPGPAPGRRSAAQGNQRREQLVGAQGLAERRAEARGDQRVLCLRLQLRADRKRRPPQSVCTQLGQQLRRLRIRKMSIDEQQRVVRAKTCARLAGSARQIDGIAPGFES